MRLDAPQQAMRRVATADTELGGRKIAAGDYVWLVFGSANLELATELDLEREAEPPRRLRPGDPPVHRRAARAARGPGRARGAARTHRRRSSSTARSPARRWPRLGVDRLPLRLGVNRGSFRLSGGLTLSYLPLGRSRRARPAAPPRRQPLRRRLAGRGAAARGRRLARDRARPARLRRERLGSGGALRRRADRRGRRRARPRAVRARRALARRGRRVRLRGAAPGAGAGLRDGGRRPGRPHATLGAREPHDRVRRRTRRRARRCRRACRTGCRRRASGGSTTAA